MNQYSIDIWWKIICILLALTGLEIHEERGKENNLSIQARKLCATQLMIPLTKSISTNTNWIEKCNIRLLHLRLSFLLNSPGKSHAFCCINAEVQANSYYAIEIYTWKLSYLLKDLYFCLSSFKIHKPYHTLQPTW